MKKISFCNIYDSLNQNNFLFENDNTAIGDDLLRPFKIIDKMATSYDAQVGTVEKIKVEKSDAVVFLDMPKEKNKYFQKAKELNIPMYLIIFESNLITPENWDVNRQKIFKKIFTWSDPHIDNKRFFKINYSFDFPENIKFSNENRDKFCTIISGNKRVHHPLELYSKRESCIRWFENNYPEKFDLYGVGWNEYYFAGFFKHLNRFKILKKLFFIKPFPSYRGMVDRKRDVLNQYKFSLCFENIKDVPGYITEKIFDSFLSGCVPIYLGADNVVDHIPENCFIDFRRFKTMEELFLYLDEMQDTVFLEYQENIKSFIEASSSGTFGVDYFSKTLLSEISHV